MSTRPLGKRPLLIVVVALAAALLVPVFRIWKASANRGGQQPAEPFRIAGNFYYVGANDVCAFLITGPEGHVLFGGGYPGSPPLIQDVLQMPRSIRAAQSDNSRLSTARTASPTREMPRPDA